MKTDIALIFLQGLGNSIVNFPVYYQLAKKYNVQVITYNNGSSDFFRAMGADTIGCSGKMDILTKSLKCRTHLALSLYPNWKRELLSLKAIRANEKYHFSSKPWLTPLFTGEMLPSLPRRHDIENNFEVFTRFGLTYDKKLDYASELKLVSSANGKYAVVHPTASTQYKYYPAAFWQPIIQNLQERYEKVHIISGRGATELEFCQKIKSDKCEYHAGMGFKELSALIANCQFFAGLDSSMMHLAAFFNKPVLSLWSFADFHRVYPYTPDAMIYLPREVIHSKNFIYPDEELFWIKRANPQKVLDIISDKAEPEIIKRDLSGHRLRIFIY